MVLNYEIIGKKNIIIIFLKNSHPKIYGLILYL